MSKENQQAATSGKLSLNSRFLKLLLVILAAFLVFVGPTYGVYVLLHAVHVRFFVSEGLGIISFGAGLALVWFLIRKKIIS